MTTREAIELLKIHWHTLANGGYIGSNDSGITYGEYNLAIDALERLEPKKPLRGGNHYSSTLYWICPRCSQIVDEKEPEEKFNCHYGDCCRDCGQAIDWDLADSEVTTVEEAAK